MIREPMNMVPLSPITMVRAPGWPLDQTSALKPFGSLILSSGSLSTAVATGGTGWPLRLKSCLLFSTLVASIGLRPGRPWDIGGIFGLDGAGACCCAASGKADAAKNAKLPATSHPRRYDVKTDMIASPDAKAPCPAWPRAYAFLAISVG